MLHHVRGRAATPDVQPPGILRREVNGFLSRAVEVQFETGPSRYNASGCNRSPLRCVWVFLVAALAVVQAKAICNFGADGVPIMHGTRHERSVAKFGLPDR
jgi:hypothetical protein